METVNCSAFPEHTGLLPIEPDYTPLDYEQLRTLGKDPAVASMLDQINQRNNKIIFGESDA